MMIDDFAHQQRAHLHHQNIAEMFAVKDAVFAGIFLIDGIMVVRNWIDRMQHAGDMDVSLLFAIADVAVAVIIIHGQAKDQRIPACVFLRQRIIPQQAFQRVLRVTPFEYLLKYRIFYATKLMQQQDPAASSISNLAITVGFGNISYFNKVFKRVLNMTPTEYKKQEGLL